MTTMNIRLGFASDQDGRPYTTWASAYVYDDSDSACYSNVMISRNGKFNIMTEMENSTSMVMVDIMLHHIWQLRF